MSKTKGTKSLRGMIYKRNCSNTSDGNNDNIVSSTRPSALLRSDYKAPQYLVPQVQLEFDLDPERTIVRSRLHISRAKKSSNTDLVLNGVDLELESIKIISPASKHDKQLSSKKADYVLKPGLLTIPASRLPSQKTFVVWPHVDGRGGFEIHSALLFVLLSSRLD